jgi:ATP-dependent DNA ligase
MLPEAIFFHLQVTINFCRTVFSAQPLKSTPLPFDHSDYLYENRYDGFRALAVIESGRCRLVSRNGNEFKTFAFVYRYMHFRSLFPPDTDIRTLLDGQETTSA